MPLFRKKCRTGPAFMLQNGPFSPKIARLPFFKLIRAFHSRHPDVTKTAFWAVLSVLILASVSAGGFAFT
jgi:hypothetical protein